VRITSQSQKTFEDYDGFVEKFKPKKTTDDCYTPPAVYETIKNWACRKYGIDPEKIVRPFYPGGDYENFEYSDGAVVLDNPPFSIITKIVRFYAEKNIRFFLFCPALTCLGLSRFANLIFADANIIYENGAEVKTAFVTSYGDNVVETAPDLRALLKEAQKSTAPPLGKYLYPENVLSVKSIMFMDRHGQQYALKRKDAAFVCNLDSMRSSKRGVFGGCLLLDEKAAAEKAAAEKAAAEKAAAEKAAAEKIELSAREKLIVEYLNAHA